MDAQGTSVVTRIGFAERWLHRARTQCSEGDVTGGLLTLALADAEVRYALEAGGWRTASRPARTAERNTVGWLTLAAAAAALVLVWAGLPASRPTVAADVDGPPVIRFSSDLGRLLSPATVLPSAAPAHAGIVAGRTDTSQRTVVRPKTGSTAAPTLVRQSGSPPAAVSGAVPSVRGLSGTAPASTPAAAAGPATSSAGPAPVVLSEADLINIVIAASRALQGSGP